MSHFDEVIPRAGTLSSRWQGRGETLALTVGDSDFRLPPPVQKAIEERLAEGVLGYDSVPDRLRELIVRRLKKLYGWRVETDWLIFLPGVVQGLNLCCRGLAAMDEQVLVETPVYYPFLDAPGNGGRQMQTFNAHLAEGRWQFDLKAFAKFAARPESRLFLFCNPQNPLGRVSRREELEQLADICLKEDVTIVADEIHCDVIYGDQQHVPIASLSPAVAEASVTLMGPSKTFAISGLGGAFAIIPGETLRDRFNAAAAGLVPNLHALAIAALNAVYGECDDWYAEEKAYLEENCNLAVSHLRKIPGLELVEPEGTYFLWLDFSGTGLNDPYNTLLEAGVELSEGGKFGDSACLRLNFASPREVLIEALDRISLKLCP
jgi:cystathionine beta-lyase